MTKEEVLQGALTLNGDNKNYTVTVEGDRIITTARYSSHMHERTGTFRSIACLNDDNTYVELHEDADRRYRRGGKAAKVQKSISFTFEDSKIKVEKDQFNSEDCKKVVRDYLASCGYKRTSKGFFKRLFKK